MLVKTDHIRLPGLVRQTSKPHCWGRDWESVLNREAHWEEKNGRILWKGKRQGNNERYQGIYSKCEQKKAAWDESLIPQRVGLIGQIRRIQDDYAEYAKYEQNYMETWKEDYVEADRDVTKTRRQGKMFEFWARLNTAQSHQEIEKRKLEMKEAK